jgi:alpha-galactosidase
MKLRLLVFSLLLTCARADDVWLSAVTNVRDADNEHTRPALDKNAHNQPLRIAGHEFEKGIGVQVENRLAIQLNGATRFVAQAGVDDATTATDPVRFEIQVDGQSVWHRDLKKGDAPAAVDVDVTGKKLLVLVTNDIGNSNTEAYADWAEAKFVTSGDKPKSTAAPLRSEEAIVLTPPVSLAPQINGARVFGVRPGNPFLFTIAATGERPVKFAAENLPNGLSLDAATGRITGVISQPGSYVVTLRATNGRGTAESKLRIEAGERIALTPPLGWNSWNCWGPEVNADKVLRSAHAMVSSGLAQHGWTYINIDDAWQAVRGKFTALQGNEKFSDLKKLADEVHEMGLKIGIYSTPWITSYAGYPGGSADNPEGKWEKPAGGTRPHRALGKYSFATNDAKQWAEWGFDYLKYDWNPNQPPETEEMWKALRASGRDIVFSLSNSAPFANAAQLSQLSNAWRTTGDITDTWGRMSTIGFGQEKWRPFAGPSHWNDPDMLVVGYVDVGKGRNLHPTRLTPNEQYTHITLWSLLCSPLLIGCDLERLDPFTLNLLTNDEVLAVNQDELGAQATQTLVDGRKQIWVKNLADGSRAIGLFNLAQEPQEVSVGWSQLKLTKPARVRDLWRQRDLSVDEDKIAAVVPRHGAFFIRVWPTK